MNNRSFYLAQTCTAAKCFTSVTSKPLHEVHITVFNLWASNWGRRLCNLTKITQHRTGRSGIWGQAVKTHSKSKLESFLLLLPFCPLSFLSTSSFRAAFKQPQFSPPLKRQICWSIHWDVFLPHQITVPFLLRHLLPTTINNRPIFYLPCFTAPPSLISLNQAFALAALKKRPSWRSPAILFHSILVGSTLLPSWISKLLEFHALPWPVLVFSRNFFLPFLPLLLSIRLVSLYWLATSLSSV